ncbi:hypothetical protein FQN49_004861 [Arthroderma sp. PD_2]|nr:hypothetical protein FQN49_004861 [Arthroderma sp. PD_2]
MRVSWLTFLAVGGLVGEVTSALLPRNWSTGEPGIGYEAAAKPATKAAFGPFQNVTIPTQVATGGRPETTSTSDEPTFLTTSYMSYTKTLSLVENTAHMEGKVAMGGESASTDLISMTMVEQEAHCPNTKTVTVTITDVATETMGSVTTFTSSDEQPTFSSSAISESSPTAGSIIRIPTFTEAKTTQLAPESHSIGPGLRGWNASTFVAASTSEVYKAGSPGYEIKHAATAVPIPSMQPEFHERQVGAVVIATMNGKVVSWKNEWSGKPKSPGTSSIATKSSVPTSDIHTQEATRTIQMVRSRTHEAGAAPTSCGETGYFTINFDDLPSYSPGKDQKAAYPPIFSPYHHFFFSGGWSYGPPPAEPFAPVSNPHIGIYVPAGKKGVKARPKGEFGAGPRAAKKLFWFDAFVGHAGCDNGNSTMPCELTVTGLKYSAESDTEIPAGTSKFVIPPCIGPKHCNLTRLIFGDGFSGLSGMEIEARVGGKAVTWYVDDLKLRWHDDTCAAGIERQRSRF